MSEQTANTTTEIETTPQAAGKKSISTREEARYIVPPVDIYETEEALTVVADLPGVDKNDVDIRIEDGVLTIKGKATYSPPMNSIRNEFGLLSFYRQFQLSDEVDQEKIAAEVKNGVLTIYLPKAVKAKPRKIDIKVG
jgi:HSP20 family protein